jgi:hypothetical protein
LNLFFINKVVSFFWKIKQDFVQFKQPFLQPYYPKPATSDKPFIARLSDLNHTMLEPEEKNTGSFITRPRPSFWTAEDPAAGLTGTAYFS